MALIICNECNKNVSDQASSCPHCGAPIKLNEFYSEEEKELVTVKVSNAFVIPLCVTIIIFGMYCSWFLHTTFSVGIYSIIPIIVFLLVSGYVMYILKTAYVTLTNKRIFGKIAYNLFEGIEMDFPLRQVKNISTFGIFGISHFRISTDNKKFQIPFAVNGKKFKKEYFNLIENKYKYN